MKRYFPHFALVWLRNLVCELRCCGGVGGSQQGQNRVEVGVDGMGNNDE